MNSTPHLGDNYETILYAPPPPYVFASSSSPDTPFILVLVAKQPHLSRAISRRGRARRHFFVTGLGTVGYRCLQEARASAGNSKDPRESMPAGSASACVESSFGRGVWLMFSLGWGAKVSLKLTKVGALTRRRVCVCKVQFSPRTQNTHRLSRPVPSLSKLPTYVAR